MSDKDRRDQALFPIGIVSKLTQLSARQIRYYEEQELILATRTSGKQRLFSFNDVERLLEVKQLLEQGLNIAGIKQVLFLKQQVNKEQLANPSSSRNEISIQEVRQLIRQQLFTGGPRTKESLIHGELSRFYQ